MPEWNKVFITPQKFHDDIIKLTELIRPHKDKYNCVHGIPKGGSIIASYIAYYLDLENLMEEQMKEQMDDWYDIDIAPVLLIDDLVDTGKTLNKYTDKDVKIDSAVLYYKPRSVIIPTYFVEQSPNDQWIVYPYEQPNEIPNRDI